MTATQGVPIARIPTGQSVDLFTAVGHLLDAALGGALESSVESPNHQANQHRPAPAVEGNPDR